MTKDSPHSILLVEDHPDSAFAVSRVLESAGYAVTVATSVADAVQIVIKDRFNLIISDIGLPDGSGLRLIHGIRPFCDTPAIALTGFGSDADAIRCQNAGFDLHLSKPVNAETLLAGVRRILPFGRGLRDFLISRFQTVIDTRSMIVSVRVPATSANLGPGFDALGVALRLANVVTVRRADAGSTDAMAAESAAAFFAASRKRAFPFAWEIRGDVPRSRGLGSSVTVRLGLLHGLNGLAGAPLDAERLYRLCAELEGHPDNAAPAAFGGFTVARPDGGYQRFRVASHLRFALLIPDFEVRTADARRVLPKQIPFPDAVRSAGNAAAIAAAFASRNYAALRGCFADGLHQPARAPLVPGLDTIIAAGVKAGAVGGWLSGSGSTVACLAPGDAGKIAAAMKRASGWKSALAVVAAPDNRGVVVTTRS